MLAPVDADAVAERYERSIDESLADASLIDAGREPARPAVIPRRPDTLTQIIDDLGSTPRRMSVRTGTAHMTGRRAVEWLAPASLDEAVALRAERGERLDRRRREAASSASS